MAGTGSEKSHQQLVEDTERWFLRRGIPHFIEDYSAGEDVFTRAIPILGLFFLVEMTGATNLEWRWWQNTLAVLGAIALVLGVWALINTRRGRRRWQAPDRVGPVELTLFVVVPALLPLLFGGQIGAAAVTATVNLVVLATVYLVTSYGLISMTRWAFGQMFRQLGAVTGLLGRALPLLFLFSVTLFINTEVWQVASSLDGLLMALTIGLFVSIGLAFLLSRLPGEMRQLRDDVSGDGAADACIGTPLEQVACAMESVPDAPPLSRRQRGNVLLVLLFSQAVQVVLVTVLMGLFFLVLGLLTIREPVIVSWIGELDADSILLTQTVGDHQILLTRPLVNVSLFLAVLSGFYFTVYAVIDPTYREQFFDGIIDEVRQAMGVRSVYLEERRLLHR